SVKIKSSFVLNGDFFLLEVGVYCLNYRQPHATRVRYPLKKLYILICCTCVAYTRCSTAKSAHTYILGQGVSNPEYAFDSVFPLVHRTVRDSQRRFWLL